MPRPATKANPAAPKAKPKAAKAVFRCKPTSASGKPANIR
jgi:hypothetical protein